MKDPEKQLDQLRAAIEERPEDAARYLELARLLFELDRWEESARALAAYGDGSPGGAAVEVIGSRAELASKLLRRVRTPLALGAVARSLGEGIRSARAPREAQGALALALDRLIEAAHIDGARGRVLLPGGWEAERQVGLTVHLPETFSSALKRLSGWLYAVAVLLPLGVYGVLALAAGIGRRVTELETAAAVSVLPAVVLMVIGRGLARVVTPCGLRWCRRNLAAMIAVGVVLAALAYFATWVGAPYWMVAAYGALMGPAFVNRRFWLWYRDRIQLAREYNWRLQHAGTGPLATS